MRNLIHTLVTTELERFTANDYRGQVGAPPFTLVDGAIPVLISAPHAVTHMRDSSIKPSDDYTGALALCVAEMTCAHAMVATHTYEGDPNWDAFECCTYKQALVDYVREHGIQLVLDVHGMPAASPDAIEVGSADGTTVAAHPGADVCVARILRDELGPYLQRHAKAITLNERHAARGKNTVTSTAARECSICAMQLEINTIFRVPSLEGTHIPEGEPIPFSDEQLSHELQARLSPDPACVEATVRAIARVIELGCA